MGDQLMDAASQTLNLYQRVRADVLSLDLMPGERVTERGLEGIYGTSRTPARAALMRLEAEGLVQRDGRGWIVSPIDISEIRALAELREAIETAAIRLSISRASDADIESLTELLESDHRALDGEESVRAGGDFHVELAQLSGNKFLIEAVRNAMTRLARTRWLEVRTPEAREKAWQEHWQILEMVRVRDEEVARSLCAEHIKGTNERLLDFLGSERRRLRGNGLSIINNIETI